MAVSKVGLPLPGHSSPSVGFEAPFEMLHACHERVERSLELLERVRVHVRQHGCDENARLALNDVMRYFDIAAPQHHWDEELHVFPALLVQRDASLADAVLRLKEDHKRMECLWARIKNLFVTVLTSTCELPVFDAAADDLLNEFASLYARHIKDEEFLIYPAAIKSMAPESLSLMSSDMMRRRGVKLENHAVNL